MSSWIARSLLTALLVAPFDVAAATSVRLVSDVQLTPLPADARARDVRWADASQVYVSLGKQGVIRTSAIVAKPLTTVVPATSHGGFPLSSLLAAGTRHLIVASPFGGFGWVTIEGGRAGKTGQRTLHTIMDIDGAGDALAVLGADSGETQGLASDGVIAWTGSLSKGLSDLRPLMKGRSKPGGKDMARCGFLQTGAIRFMLDGSVVVVPGVEPGVYRYSTAGKLMQTWDTGALGIVDDCDLDEEERATLARDFPRRLDWLASRVVVDDVLSLADGPALMLRRIEKGVTKWELVTLPFRGKSERITLPVTVPTPRAHVRGDVRGNELVLLVYDSPLPGQPSTVPPRLVVLTLGRQ